MKYQAITHTIKDLVISWRQRSLLRNEEYQRGAAWSEAQKQGLIDSIFRHYPLPPLFLHRIEQRGGIGSSVNERFEVVDGQQRLLALADFVEGKFALLEPTDRRLRLPTSMRSLQVGWGGRTHSSLPEALRAEFDNTRLAVNLLEAAEDADEVRDLFIRLQAGTALSRQQVRDAWPGRIGPFVIGLAGKLDRQPSSGLFGAVDLRGQKAGDDEGEVDEFVGDRQTCAQLLRIFVAREADPGYFPNVSANDLDALYHDHTDFDVAGATSIRFKATLDYSQRVVEAAVRKRQADKEARKKQKFRKLEVMAIMCLLQDLTKNPSFKVTNEGVRALAEHLVDAARPAEPKGRITSGRAIGAYYAWWREHVVSTPPGVALDPQRSFSPEQRAQLADRDGGKCGRCGEPVAPVEAEADHYPVAHRDGGRTEVANGRLVHKDCHPRGRPPVDA